ncbi:MAG: monovalent cation/H+ antiporter complex subunit F [Rhodovarius sp.]|nr:monovalent cation/H+ antiporter complex subunit F [Rhodovarius sp.]MDW8314287.1 monovalent cation/H+ antiporter complex subunit F [Rhodovarius sp.]
MLAAAITLSGLLLAAAVVLTGWRMLRGPGIVDRAVGLDLLGLLAVAATALLALGSGHVALLDIAMGLGLVGFIGAVGIASFVERAARSHGAGRGGCRSSTAAESRSDG